MPTSSFRGRASGRRRARRATAGSWRAGAKGVAAACGACAVARQQQRALGGGSSLQNHRKNRHAARARAEASTAVYHGIYGTACEARGVAAAFSRFRLRCTRWHTAPQRALGTLLFGCLPHKPGCSNGLPSMRARYSTTVLCENLQKSAHPLAAALGYQRLFS